MTERKIGVVGIPGRWSTETLADAVAERTGFRLVVDMREVELDLATRRLLFKDWNLCDLDALIVKKIGETYTPNILDRLELLKVAQAQGVRVFSRVECILRLVDRLSCTVALRNSAIPMPDTRVTESLSVAARTVREFGGAVLKPLYSTKARGMCAIDGRASDEEIDAAIGEFQRYNPMMYVQRKLDLPGRDLGLVFLGGEYLGCYARIGHGAAWNTTIHSGGHYAPYSPSAAVIDLAARAQRIFGMDYTTVDVAETAEDPVVFEVSAFGGFRGAFEGAGINVARLYARHVVRQLDVSAGNGLGAARQ
ncbi:MAG: GAK system ATP-grasp enzyme [Gammaproteobacteria bacterium]|nr:GAK system ATP-grasp enzyme [Gammaproteobacteria bacterium]